MQEVKKIINEAQIKLLAEKIREKFHPDKIILFGSYGWGKPKTSSDIDLLVIMDTLESYPRVSAKIRLYLDETVGIIGPIDIIVRSQKEMEKRIEKGDFFLRTILNKGIPL